MHTHSRPSFAALDRMMDALALLPPIVAAIHAKDRNLADQIRRAASSVALNLAESQASRDGNARLRFRTAYGSLSETRTALQVARVWRYIGETRELDVLLDRVGAMVWRLTGR